MYFLHVTATISNIPIFKEFFYSTCYSDVLDLIFFQVFWCFYSFIFFARYGNNFNFSDFSNF